MLNSEFKISVCGFVHLWRTPVPGSTRRFSRGRKLTRRDFEKTRYKERSINEQGHGEKPCPKRRVIYFRTPSFAMIVLYRLRSSRVRYLSSWFRRLTSLSRPRREE